MAKISDVETQAIDVLKAAAVAAKTPSPKAATP